jgi:UDP:flavonoid glycosyltransferase YjiC (YdhE family)
MKFALAFHGTRGDVEPAAAVGRELLRRGHHVCAAAPPNLLGFVESVGLVAVAYGPDSQQQLDADFFRNFWKFQNPINALRSGQQYFSQGWAEMSATLMSLAGGADVLLAGANYQEVAANVAEHYGIPLAALHTFPRRGNGQLKLVPLVPSAMVRRALTVTEWVYWRMTKEAEDAQRSQLGLPKATGPGARRIVGRGSLEIQAYDELWFPGLAAEWASWDGQRPFVGALALELPTPADDEVASWVAAGTPPIAFCFGSLQVESAADTFAMISAVCAELGERALICSGATDFSQTEGSDHVKVVGLVNYASVLPNCRAAVHNGGAGTTAAVLRAGIPALILWIGADQPVWANRVKRLKVGSASRFSRTNRKTLAADLRSILVAEYAARARAVASGMTQPAKSVAIAADLLEQTAANGLG